ncbi:MAG: hypothetical protein KAR56_04155 [Thermoplasmata archaeon]|nr:hypothetical protein [Thermoplasmata archaeon]
MEQIPQSMHAECPDCNDETLHKTLKGRMRGKKKLEMLLKCTKCGKVHQEVLEAISQVPVRMIISRGDKSEKIRAEFSADWELAVGDEFMHEDEHLQVSGIEVDGRRVENAIITQVQTLWTINYDMAKIKVSINRDGKTRSLELEVSLDEEFEIDSEIEVDGVKVTIHSIKLEDKRLRRGTATARDIVRVYCTDKRPIRPKYRKKNR